MPLVARGKGKSQGGGVCSQQAVPGLTWKGDRAVRRQVVSLLVVILSIGLWLSAKAGAVWLQRSSGFEKGMIGQMLIQFNLNMLRANS